MILNRTRSHFSRSPCAIPAIAAAIIPTAIIPIRIVFPLHAAYHHD